MSLPGFEAEPRFSVLSSKVFGSEEILPPGITLEVDRPEWAVHKDELLWFIPRTQALVAAQFASVGITQRNVDRITVVTDVLLVNAGVGATGVRVGMVQPAVGTAFTRAASRDLRRLGVTTEGFVNAQAGDQLASIPPLTLLPQTSLVLPPARWMLQSLPGGASALLVQGDAVNTSITAYFWGYERRLRPEERL